MPDYVYIPIELAVMIAAVDRLGDQASIPKVARELGVSETTCRGRFHMAWRLGLLDRTPGRYTGERFMFSTPLARLRSRPTEAVPGGPAKEGA